MRVAVTGAAGQLGSEVVAAFGAGHEVLALGRSDLDITDFDQVMQVLGAWRADAIINCAAFTDVDHCEADRDLAFAVNALGVRHLAEAAESVGAQLCHISTDYVFDGAADSFSEWDAPHPISVYGASKLAGEQEVQAIAANWLIVRTAWLYGEHGHNFVKTMLMLAGEQETIEVVDDQRGCPSYAVDVASAVCSLVIRRRRGTFHVTNQGETTWYGFARAIFHDAGLNPDRVKAASSSTIRRPAARPASSVLEHAALADSAIGLLRPWRDALSEFMSQRTQGGK